MAKPADLERIVIHWYVVPNTNQPRGGWMPVYARNGKQHGDTYGTGYDLETALKMAKAVAEDEASRYVGDWDVVVAPKPGSPGREAQEMSRKAGKVSEKVAGARRAGAKATPPTKMSLDTRVRAYLGRMQPGTEIDANGIARALGDVAPLEADHALARARKAGRAVTSDGRWFGPSGVHVVQHVTKKRSPAQLDREIAEVLRSPSRGHAHATMESSVKGLFAVEIDPAVFDRDHELPFAAEWRRDLVPLAEEELARGRSYRRPKDARYEVVAWTGYRAGVGKLLEWLEETPGITRYAEIHQ